MDSGNITLIAAGTLAVIAILRAVVLKVIERGVAAGQIPTLETVMTRCDDLRKKVELLNDHLDTYFHALNSAGLSELNEIARELTLAAEDTLQLYNEQNFQACTELCSFLADGRATLTRAMQRNSRATLPSLVNWASRSDKLLLKCIANLSQSTVERQSLGIKRMQRRRSTTCTLDEIRSLLDNQPPIGQSKDTRVQ